MWDAPSPGAAGTGPRVLSRPRGEGQLYREQGSRTEGPRLGNGDKAELGRAEPAAAHSLSHSGPQWLHERVPLCPGTPACFRVPELQPGALSLQPARRVTSHAAGQLPSDLSVESAARAAGRKRACCRPLHAAHRDKKTRFKKQVLGQKNCCTWPESTGLSRPGGCHPPTQARPPSNSGPGDIEQGTLDSTGRRVAGPVGTERVSPSCPRTARPSPTWLRPPLHPQWAFLAHWSIAKFPFL